MDRPRLQEGRRTVARTDRHRVAGGRWAVNWLVSLSHVSRPFRPWGENYLSPSGFTVLAETLRQTNRNNQYPRRFGPCLKGLSQGLSQMFCPKTRETRIFEVGVVPPQHPNDAALSDAALQCASGDILPPLCQPWEPRASSTRTWLPRNFRPSTKGAERNEHT